MATGDNDRFVRLWHEVDQRDFDRSCPSKEGALESNRRWVPFNKGGAFRKWYGNQDCILSFSRSDYEVLKQMGNHCPSEDLYFKTSFSWSKVTSGGLSVRYYPEGFIFADAGMSVFAEDEKLLLNVGSILNTKLSRALCAAISPTLNYEVGIIRLLPFCEVEDLFTESMIALAKEDWDSYEFSWDFIGLPLLHLDYRQPSLEETYNQLRAHWRGMTLEMQRLEEKNNCIFIEAYGLQDELTPKVPLDEITLTCSPRHRYGPGKLDEEYDALQRSDTMQELLSYSVGCMMGRYSLDEPGLIYAHSASEGFDRDCYATFPADADGIIPLTDYEWFDDDATNRFVEFMGVAWPKEHLAENLDFVAESLGARKGEQSRDTIRRYLAMGFFKDHMKTYKKRPIYWLFSSGKQRAFQCLVYLHRYNEGTLARMRTEYVIPLQGKMDARINNLDRDIDAATSTSHTRKLEKERGTLGKQLEELRAYDDRLRHYADQRIALDLDDGVKVNYGRFGTLLAEVKAVTGKNPEEV